MKLQDKVLNAIFYTDTHETHIGSLYQSSYAKPITKLSAPFTLSSLTDVEGLDRAYARDHGIYIRSNTTSMIVNGTKDFPQDHWGDISKIPFK